VDIRPNGWQRIGIVLSVAWLVFLAMDVASEYTGAYSGHREFVRMKVVRPPASASSSPDGSLSLDEVLGVREPRVRWRHLAIASLVPIGAGWVLAYAFVYTVRWIAAGFQRRP